MRSLLQIQESLRRKFAEADNMPTAADYLGSLGQAGPHKGEPVISPDLGGGQGPGGAGRVTIKPDTRATAGARARDRAEAEKIRAQQQQLQQQNKEVKVEPKPEPPKPAEPQSKAPKEKPSKSQEPKQQKTEPTLDQAKTDTTTKPAPIPDKPIFQSKEKYLQSLDKDQLERLKLIQDLKQGLQGSGAGLGTKVLAGTGLAAGAALPVGYLAKEYPDEVNAVIGTMSGDAPDKVSIPPESTQDNVSSNKSQSKSSANKNEITGNKIDAGDDKGVNTSDIEIPESFVKEETAQDIFLQKVIGPESGGSATIKNPRSSATGLYQFIKDTWKNTVAKAKPGDPHYGVSFKDMPKNIEAQHAAAKQIAGDYARTIKQFGLPDIPTSYYLLHGHGPAAGIKIYQNVDAPLKVVYPEFIKNKRGEVIRNPIYTQNPNLDPNKPAMQIVKKMARDMGDKITDVFPSAKAGELSSQTKTVPTSVSKDAAKPAAQSTTLTAADVAKLPPVERFGHILPGLTFNKQGGIADVGKKSYTLPDGRTISDPNILKDIYKIQQQELKKAKELSAKDDDSFLSKVGRVASGELASQVFSPKPPPPPTGSSAVPAKDSLSPGEKIIKPEELKTEPKREVPDTSKLKKELSDFEKAFAAARKEQGAKGEFTFQDPKTGKTGTYTTAYKNEKPEASVASNKEREADQTTNESLSINTELRDILRLAGRL